MVIHTPGTFELTLEAKGVVVYTENVVVEPVRHGIPSICAYRSSSTSLCNAKACLCPWMA